MSLGGVLLPLTTPFDPAGGAVAPIHFRENLRAYLETGVHGFVVAGSTGEAPLLDEGEVVQLVEWARDVVPPERTLLAGTGAESTRATIRACASGPAGHACRCEKTTTPCGQARFGHYI